MFKKRTKRTPALQKARIPIENDNDADVAISIPTKPRTLAPSRVKKYTFSELQQQYGLTDGLDVEASKTDGLDRFTDLDIESIPTARFDANFETCLDVGISMGLDQIANDNRRRAELEAALSIDETEQPELPLGHTSNKHIGQRGHLEPLLVVPIDEIQSRLVRRMLELEHQKEELEGQIQIIYEHLADVNS